jgi:exosortase C (VPDSG-CTERM-specific)
VKSSAHSASVPALEQNSALLAWWRGLPRHKRLRAAGWAAFIAGLTLAFASPLWRLLMLAAGNDLHSYTPLVPLVTAYLLSVRRTRSSAPYRSSVAGAIAFAAAGLAAVAAWMAWRNVLSGNDHLTVLVLAYVLLIAAGGFLFLGSSWMRSAAFPMAFLIFMVPLPDPAVYWIERGLVLASADASAFLFNLTGTPMYREGTILALPGIVLEVAQECSGIRSTWILFITSVLASHLFLHSTWRRMLLVAFIIPLGIVRNGFRILTIGLLCVHVGPHMIDSVIHHRGGPIFFALSLIPLFLLLVWLRRGDGGGRPSGGRPLTRRAATR